MSNQAAWICIQAKQPTVLVGGTGEAKTAMAVACAKTLGLKPFVLIPSQHMPEDIGGIPHIENKKAIMVFMDWLLDMTGPGHMLIVDELNTATQSMRPCLLSLLNEGRIGSTYLHSSTLRVAAMNPEDFAPNAMPLEASINNRLYHHQWQLPFDSWLTGMMNGGQFEMPEDFPIIGDYSSHVPKWCRRIGYLLRRAPAIRKTTEVPADEPAFPSLRVWEDLAQCLSAADSIDAPGEVKAEIAGGLVGRAAAAQLMASVASSMLYDASEVVDGKTAINYDKARIDQLVYLPCGVLETLADDHEPARVRRAVDVLLEMGDNGLLDCVSPVISDITRQYDYQLDQDHMNQYGTLLAKMGGAA
jgi:hypothetical protein